MNFNLQIVMYVNDSILIQFLVVKLTYCPWMLLCFFSKRFTAIPLSVYLLLRSIIYCFSCVRRGRVSAGIPDSIDILLCNISITPLLLSISVRNVGDCVQCEE